MQDPIAGAMSAMATAVKALVSGSAMQPAEKDPLISGIDTAMAALAATVETAVADVPTLISEEFAHPGIVPIQAEVEKLGVSAVPAVEGALAAAAEQAVDAELVAVTGPFSPIAIKAANALMEAVGGKLADALSHLLHINGVSEAPAIATGAAVAKSVEAATASPQ